MGVAAPVHCDSQSAATAVLGVDQVDEIDAYVADLVAAAPPLTTAQVDRVRGLVRSSTVGRAASA